MIFSENRCALFRIMLEALRHTPSADAATIAWKKRARISSPL